MRTLEEIKTELLSQNHSKQYELNNEIFEMTDAEFTDSINKKAEMLFAQEQYAEEIEQAEAAAEAKRQALLERLGITEEEARLLLS